MNLELDKAVGCLVGLAIGDAVGTTLEFCPKGSFEPIHDMLGGGKFSLKKGYWTDDTSMALCLGHSLIDSNGFNASDQMTKYCDWLDNGYMSSVGVCFDVGVTVSSALRRFQKTGNAFSGSTARWSSGNGSLMRLAPVPIFYSSSLAQTVRYSEESSRTTHGSILCRDSSRYFGLLLAQLINGSDKALLMNPNYLDLSPEVESISQGDYLSKPYNDLTGSGFVIESLESALWCFAHTDSFDSCILSAANLGNDADTTAAIAGQLAGAYYGYSAIRQDWLDALYNQQEIRDLAEQLFFVGRRECAA